MFFINKNKPVVIRPIGPKAPLIALPNLTTPTPTLVKPFAASLDVSAFLRNSIPNLETLRVAKANPPVDNVANKPKLSPRTLANPLNAFVRPRIACKNLSISGSKLSPNSIAIALKVDFICAFN